MRLETYFFDEFKLWLASIMLPHTAFSFQAGATWKDGTLLFYLEMDE